MSRLERGTCVYQTMKLAIPGFAIIDRYVAREVLAPFAVDVGLLTFALVTGKLLKLMDMVVNHGVSLGEVMRNHRVHHAGLSRAYVSDGGAARRADGLRADVERPGDDRGARLRYQPVPAGDTGVDRGAGRVRGFELLRVLAAAVGEFQSARASSTSSARPGPARVSRKKSSTAIFPGLVVYVDEMSDVDSSLKGVMISDARDPHNQNTIIAKHGAMLPDPKTKTTHAAAVRRLDFRRRAAERRDARDQLQDLRPECQSRGIARRQRRGAGRDDLLGIAARQSRRRAPRASPTTTPRPRWRASLPSRLRRCCSRCSVSRSGSSRRAAGIRSASA